MTNDLADDEQLLPHESPQQTDVRHKLGRLLAAAPFPPEELVDNLPLFLRRQPLADLLSIDALYRMVLDIPGVIMEFGVHRGRHAALFTALRSVYEPYNPHRRVIGFDTFEGFPDVAAVDELGRSAVQGKFALPNGYADYLREVVSAHEADEPLGHIRRTLLVEGDIRETLRAEPRRAEHHPPVPRAWQCRGLRRAQPCKVARRDCGSARCLGDRRPAAPCSTRQRYTGISSMGRIGAI
jgi:hypothetical protein